MYDKVELIHDGGEDPEVTFCHDGCRSSIRKYSNEPQFRVADEVYIRSTAITARQGPYTVLEVENKKYKLGDSEGNAIQNGHAFEEDELEEKDPFE
ncbi:hypothetical protein F5Y06DRAFT_292681 [Hypoxylon sp. FL0890]|nr:hypothetical protein F5Y06DRAFT_292681 [Hypoxylon sp. FL0890]